MVFAGACGGGRHSASDAGPSLSAGDSEVSRDAAAGQDRLGGDSHGGDAALLPAVDAGFDLDRDGLDDAYEADVVARYLPFLSIHPDDGCPRAAIVFRLRPHPDSGRRLHATVAVLFERDCGAGRHPGDDEVFGMTIDPATPPPQGLLAVRAIAHQDTACDEATECGLCPGLAVCRVASRRGADYPVVYFSRGKHGAYTDPGTCDGSCFFTNFCALSETGAEPPVVNAGEPSAPLVRDLTAAGIITSTAGWRESSLFHHDPWGPQDFGTAGNIASDLTDPDFLTPTCE